MKSPSAMNGFRSRCSCWVGEGGGGGGRKNIARAHGYKGRFIVSIKILKLLADLFANIFVPHSCR
jgi:hypothetical protein